MIDLLARPEMNSLNQRIGARVLLKPLPAAEVREYIDCRLRTKGGAAKKIFAPAALNHLVQHSRGIPRRTNVLCHNSMLLGFAAGRARVNLAIARTAVNEFENLLGGQPALHDQPARALGLKYFARAALAVAAFVLVALGVLYVWSISVRVHLQSDACDVGQRHSPPCRRSRYIRPRDFVMAATAGAGVCRQRPLPARRCAIMSKYYEAITRPHQPQQPQQVDGLRRADTSVFNGSNAASHSLVPLPTLEHVPAAVARASAIRNLTERLAPVAVVERTSRLLVTGCRPGDGASTVATAIAIDISQRLGLRTMLVDAHLRHPSLHRLFQHPGRRTPELVLDGALQIRGHRMAAAGTGHLLPVESGFATAVVRRIRNFAGAYPAVIVDLGVTRLDARMLPLARSEDPILVVVRQGHTERRELATTASALRAARRSVAGVILNDATDPVAKPLRRLLGT